MNKITSRTFLYENFRFFKTNLDTKLLPLTLSSFESLQRKIFLQEKQTLHMQWREYLISEIQDTLRDIYRFYQTESKLYYDSELQRLLKRIDAMFNTYLRINIVKGNIDHWCDFLQRFTGPNYNSFSSEPGQNSSETSLVQYHIFLVNMRKKEGL